MRAVIIHLRLPLPTAWCGLPADVERAARLLEPVSRFTWPCSGWGLPSHASHLACWWSLTPPFHPYQDFSWRFAFCGTVPRVTPGGRYPPPCPMESGLSSIGSSPTAITQPTRPLRWYALGPFITRRFGPWVRFRVPSAWASTAHSVRLTSDSYQP